jgi:hypothetical protein
MVNKVLLHDFDSFFHHLMLNVDQNHGKKEHFEEYLLLDYEAMVN